MSLKRGEWSGRIKVTLDGPRAKKVAANGLAVILLGGVSACAKDEVPSLPTDPALANTTSATAPIPGVTLTPAALPSSTSTFTPETVPTPSAMQTPKASPTPHRKEVPKNAITIEDARQDFIKNDEQGLWEKAKGDKNAYLRMVAQQKAYLWLHASEYQSGLLDRGGCGVSESSRKNPIFTDVREMSEYELYCASQMKHIALAQTSNGVLSKNSFDSPLDKKLAMKVLQLDAVGQRFNTLQSGVEKFNKEIKLWEEIVKENDNVRSVNYAESLQAVSIVGTGTRTIDDVAYKTIYLKDEREDSALIQILLVPVERPIVLPGESKTRDASSGSDIDYGTMRYDEKGAPVSAYAEEPLMMPINLGLTIR